MTDRSPKDSPESVQIWLKNGRKQRIASPWLYKDEYGTWMCKACKDKEMSEAHSRSKEHKRLIWYYCFGYGKGYGPGRLMNAVEGSVRHSKQYKYPTSGSMMEKDSWSGDKWASAAAAAAAGQQCGPAGVQVRGASAGDDACGQDPVEKFQIGDSASNVSELDLGPSLKEKLDDVIATTRTMQTFVDEAKLLAEKMPTLETKIDEMKSSFDKVLPLFEAKINEMKQSIESKARTLEAQVTQMNAGIDSRVTTLEAKIEEVKQSIDTKVATIASKIDEVKHDIETKVPTLEAKMDTLLQEVRAREAQSQPWQGSPTLSMRGSKSEGRLDGLEEGRK